MKTMYCVIKIIPVRLFLVLAILFCQNAQSQIEVGQTCPPCNAEEVNLVFADRDLKDASNLYYLAKSDYAQADEEYNTALEKVELAKVNFDDVLAAYFLSNATKSDVINARTALEMEESNLKVAEKKRETAFANLVNAERTVINASGYIQIKVQELADCKARGNVFVECLECVSGKVEPKKKWCKLCNGVYKRIRYYVITMITNCDGFSVPVTQFVEYPEVPPTPGTFGKLTIHYGEDGLRTFCEGEETIIIVKDITCD